MKKQNHYKNVSIKLIISILMLVFYVNNTQITFALKRAIFPDQKSLQPIPTDTHANISGNINSTTNMSPTTQTQGTTPNTQNPIVNTAPQNETRNQTNIIFYIMWFSIILFILSGTIFIYKKIKQKQNSLH